MANKMTRPLLIASLLSGAAGFKFMSNFKMPTIQGQLQEKKAEAKFGSKKLVVITGTKTHSAPRVLPLPQKSAPNLQSVEIRCQR